MAQIVFVLFKSWPFCDSNIVASVGTFVSFCLIATRLMPRSTVGK